MFTLVAEWWQDFVDFMRELWTDFTEFLYDFFVFVYDQATQIILSLFDQLPVPDFLQTGLGGVVGSFAEAITWTLVQTGFPQALAILGAGATFFMLRKLITLGRW